MHPPDVQPAELIIPRGGRRINPVLQSLPGRCPNNLSLKKERGRRPSPRVSWLTQFFGGASSGDVTSWGGVRRRRTRLRRAAITAIRTAASTARYVQL